MLYVFYKRLGLFCSGMVHAVVVALHHLVHLHFALHLTFEILFLQFVSQASYLVLHLSLLYLKQSILVHLL